MMETITIIIQRRDPGTGNLYMVEGILDSRMLGWSRFVPGDVLYQLVKNLQADLDAKETAIRYHKPKLP